jgi:hypothetical protein
MRGLMRMMEKFCFSEAGHQQTSRCQEGCHKLNGVFWYSTYVKLISPNYVNSRGSGNRDKWKWKDFSSLCNPFCGRRLGNCWYLSITTARQVFQEEQYLVIWNRGH